MSMLGDKLLRVESITGDGKRPYVTVFPTYEWVALGTYWNKTGGMDTYKNNQETFDALEYAWMKYPEYDILMEGVIASTIFSTYLKLFRLYRKRMNLGVVPIREIIILNFLPPVEVCIARVKARQDVGKQVKEELIRSKWRSVDKNSYQFRQYKFTSLRVDNSKTPKEKMLIKFLDLCDKYRW